MLQIMLACARTGQFVSTGIETDLDTFAALPEVVSSMRCPACGNAHYWTKSETWICHADAKLPAEILLRN
jgi:hypothetical protein